jgi:hypothetical protein
MPLLISSGFNTPIAATPTPLFAIPYAEPMARKKHIDGFVEMVEKGLDEEGLA